MNVTTQRRMTKKITGKVCTLLGQTHLHYSCGSLVIICMNHSIMISVIH